MNLEIVKTKTQYILQGGLVHSDTGLPNKGCQVILFDDSREKVVGKRTTDTYGNYQFIFDVESLLPGNYTMRFRGTGNIPAPKPVGDWEPFEIQDFNGIPSAKIISSNGEIFKYSGTYDPVTTVLTLELNNIYNATYQWYKDGTPVATTSGLTLIMSDVFSSGDVHNYSCTINGFKSNNDVALVTTDISLVKILDGSLGPGVVYRGHYNSANTYYHTSIREDVVSISGIYYVCNTTTPSPAGTWNESYWTSFSNQFASVATDILLAQDATITRSLVMGTEDNTNYGLIRSVNANSLINGDGFYLAGTADGKGLFRVGSSTLSLGLQKGIMWDGTNFTIKAANMEITTSGSLWANSGGFGGTVYAPAISLISTGLSIGNKVLITNQDDVFDDQSVLMGTNALEGLTPSLLIPNFYSYWSDTYPLGGGSYSDAGISTISGLYLHARMAEGSGAARDVAVITNTAYTVPGVTTSPSTYTFNAMVATDAVGGQGGDARINIKNAAGEILKTIAVNFGTVTSTFVDIGLGYYDYTNHMSGWKNVTTSFTTTETSFYIEFYARSGDFAYGPDSYFDTTLYVKNINLTVYQPKIILSSQGILVFQSPANFFKMSPTEFIFKNGELEIEDLIVKGNLRVYGSTISVSTSTEINRTTSNTFIVGSLTNTGNTGLTFGTYTTPNTLTSNGSIITSSVPIVAPSFTRNGREVGVPIVKQLQISSNLLSNVDIDLPDSNTYIMGEDKLWVFVDGRLQIKDIDFIEVTTSKIQFLYDLASGARITFIIIG
jgi:hypothetical protein